MWLPLIPSSLTRYNVKHDWNLGFVKNLTMRKLNTLNLIYYSWPLYATILSILTITIFLAFDPSYCLPAIVVAIPFAWFGIASIVAFYWMYDTNTFFSCAWIPEKLKLSPKHCLQVSLGLKETTLQLNEVFSNCNHETLDIFDPLIMTEPGLRRARKCQNLSPNTCVPFNNFPIQDHWANSSFLILAAHEIRDQRKRDELFVEMIKKTREGGDLIVVEHIRNLLSYISFGPGAFHIYPKKEWTRISEKFNLELIEQFWVNPYIYVYKFRVLKHI